MGGKLNVGLKFLAKSSSLTHVESSKSILFCSHQIPEKYFFYSLDKVIWVFIFELIVHQTHKLLVFRAVSLSLVSLHVQ